MAIAKLMPEIPALNSLRVRALNAINTCNGTEHGEMASNRVMEAREEAVQCVHSYPGMDIEACASSPCAKPLTFPRGLAPPPNSCPYCKYPLPPRMGCIYRIRRSA